MNKKYWWILVLYLIIQVVSTFGIYYVALLDKTTVFTKEQANLIVTNWSIGTFAIGALLFLWLIKTAPPSSYIDKQTLMPLAKSMLYIIGGVIVAFIAQAITASITAMIRGNVAQSENTADLIGITQTNPLFILTIVIIAPFLEEVVFRKVLFGALTNKLPVGVAALFSSVVFAAIHFDFAYLLVYTGMGLVFCYFYYKTKRLFVSFSIHALMNGTALLLSVFLT